MVPSQVFCRVVRIVTELGRRGTGFLFDHADGLALVTAAHLSSGLPEELITFQQAWGDAEPVTDYLDLIGHDSVADVAAYTLPEEIWPKWFVGRVNLDSGGLIYGQDCFMLGYPYGLSSPIGEEGNQIPIVRKGIFAGSFNHHGQRGWYVDATANPGFSGGPVIFEISGSNRQYAIAGLVRGVLTAPMQEPTEEEPNPERVTAGLTQCTDVKHILDLGLENRG